MNTNTPQDYINILTTDTELLPLLTTAYTLRKKTWGNEVQLHIINNIQNGHCPEDCGYCAQGKNSDAPITEYTMKSDAEILAEAKAAHESGAYRYCMVLSGRGPSNIRVNKLAKLIQTIKSQYPIQICLSAGLVNDTQAAVLKAAGLNRLNHNLNTSEHRYAEICTTHTFEDRLNTLHAAQNAGIEACSGVIVGMGETPEDLVEVAYKLKELNVPSIPVNFLLPIEGTPIDKSHTLTPQYCLKVLCVFRLINPTAEIRIAAGREYHLRSLQPLALYPANSMFVEGYLNTPGDTLEKTLQMIEDNGFKVAGTHDTQQLLEKRKATHPATPKETTEELHLKTKTELRPYRFISN